jgi:hypothetical protein
MLIRDPPLIRWSIHAPDDGFLNHRASYGERKMRLLSPFTAFMKP